MVYRFLQKFIYYVDAAIFGIAASLAIICVFFRYILNNSIFWGEEAIRLMFIWIFMLGAAECCRKDNHLTLDLVLNMWPKPIRRIWKILIDIILICFLIMLAYLGIRSCYNNMGLRTAALGISFGIAYMAIPLGAILMLFFVTHNLIDRIKNKKPSGE